MPVPGPLELALILVIVAMLFGVGKLPEVFGAVGKGIREFRKESTLEGADTSTEAIEAPAEKPAPAAATDAAPAPAANGAAAPAGPVATESPEGGQQQSAA